MPRLRFCCICFCLSCFVSGLRILDRGLRIVATRLAMLEGRERVLGQARPQALFGEVCLGLEVWLA